MTELIILYENNPHEISITGTRDGMVNLFNDLYKSKINKTDIQRVVNESTGDTIMISPTRILHMSLKNNDQPTKK